MSWKKQKISMPLTTAGIIGLSPYGDVGGIKIKPMDFIIFTLIFLAVVKILGMIYA